jgi:hypothetical protein
MGRKAPIWIGVVIAVFVVGVIVWRAVAITPRGEVIDGERVVFVTGRQASMQAVLEGGTLTRDDNGCLRVGEQVVIWPRSYSLSGREGAVTVFNGEGEAVATVGEAVTLSGGEASTRLLGLPIADCPGPYWHSNGVVTTP